MVSKKLLAKQTESGSSYTPPDWLAGSLASLNVNTVNPPFYESSSATVTSNTGVFVDTTGTHMIIGSASNIDAVSMSTAHNITTSSLVLARSSMTAYGSYGMHLNPAGTRMYRVGSDKISVVESTLASAWDISNMTPAVYTLDISAYGSDFRDITMSVDGTKLYAVDYTLRDVVQFSLSTAFDLSTASYIATKSFYDTGAADFIHNISLSDDGSILYAGTQFSMYRYTMSTPYDISTLYKSSGIYAKGFPYTRSGVRGASVVGDSNIYYGDQSLDIVGQISFTYDTKFNFTWDDFSNTIGYAFLGTPTGTVSEAYAKDMFWSIDGTYLYIIGQSRDKPIRFTCSTPYDIRTVKSGVYDTCNLTFTTTVEGMFISPDGVNLYVVESGTDLVFWATMSTPWDITTCTMQSSSTLTSGFANLSAIHFSPDGKKLYITDGTTDSCRQYELSTAWDIDTASYVNEKGLAVSTVESVHISSDGMYLYCLGYTTYLRVFSFGTPWDISTLSTKRLIYYSSTLLGGYQYPTGLTFNEDGSKMWIITSEGESIFEFTTI